MESKDDNVAREDSAASDSSSSFPSSSLSAMSSSSETQVNGVLCSDDVAFAMSTAEEDIAGCSSDSVVVAEHQACFVTADSTPPGSPSFWPSGCGQRFKLLLEGDIQLCRLDHTRTVVSKIMNSKYLRRWESHHLNLGNSEIFSTTPHGFMENVISYSSIVDINKISRWDAGHKFCFRITITDGSLLLQAASSYLRDQWLHSIHWKRQISKHGKLLRNTRRMDVLIKEIRQMVDLSLTTPIQDETVHQFPLELVSFLLQKNGDVMGPGDQEQIITALAPLLEKTTPTQHMCDFFSRHCKKNPRSKLILELFTPVIHRILKHNMDFGKYPRMRTFVQEYVQALSTQNDGIEAVKNFVRSMHGIGSQCPHPRVLPNLVAVCLSTIYSCYEDKKSLLTSPMNTREVEMSELDHRLVIYISILQTTSEFDDWRLQIASILQPIPFPDDALLHDLFIQHMTPLLSNIGGDKRCDSHATVLAVRDGKEGWFELYCPGGIACYDDGELHCVMLQRLMACCCRRKKFLQSKFKMINPWQLLALRENAAAMDALCAVLEFDISENPDHRMQIVTTLQSTSLGKKMYTDLCERLSLLEELQQKGGPHKLTLPTKSTDADLSKLLSSGSFGNLECLSLAFTQVTSSCAHDLIKLPSLRYLNLWSTQFGDPGLQLISEHMHKLQVLNLCETPVTDKGLSYLSSLKSLRKLNLNSTHLSALTFEGLKEKLPSLQECDIRYTDAW